jgi:hypothetical protein
MWVPLAAVTTSAYATVYLSVEQARQTIFPDSQFAPDPIAFTTDQLNAAARRAGTAAVRPVGAWREHAGGLFVVDRVIGKHDFITYAVGLNADGTVKQVEIMEYRESYGYEVRNSQWRRQFAGKTAADPVTLDQDIRNISGATLSCRHVTEGVKRILALYDIAVRH